MAYRILSLDGGGIRGLITIIFMERLSEQHPDFLEHVDFFTDLLWDDVKDLGRLAGAEYSSDNLKRITQEIFGDRTLGDLNSVWLSRCLTWITRQKPPRPAVGSRKYFTIFPGLILTQISRCGKLLFTPVLRRPIFLRVTVTLTAGCLPTAQA